MNKLLATQNRKDHVKTYNKLVSEPARFYKGVDWKSSRLKKESMYWIDVPRIIVDTYYGKY